MNPIVFCGLEPEERRLYRVRLPDGAASAITLTVFTYYGVNIRERTGTSRKKEFVKARQISMYLIRKKTKATLKSIGYFFDRDHSTVIYALETTKDLMETDHNYKKEVDRILNFIKDIKPSGQRKASRTFSRIEQ